MNRSVVVVVVFSLIIIALFSSLPSVSAVACTCNCPDHRLCSNGCARCDIDQTTCSCRSGCTGDSCGSGYRQTDSCGITCGCVPIFNSGNKRTCQRTCDTYNGQCLECRSGWYGQNCQNRCNGCSGRGVCNDGINGDGSCTCNSRLYNGPNCEYSRSADCNGRGYPSYWGTPCNCDSRYAGSRCNRCATNYYNYPSCSYCTASETCNNHGSCGSFGGCQCDEGYTGPGCQACATNYYRSSINTCVYCNASDTCNGNGVCSSFGQCTCTVNFAGQRCDQCVTNHWGPSCTACPGLTGDGVVCSGHGVCSSGFTGNGQCICHPSYYGDDCSLSGPRIASISPISGATKGNYSITITGISFGPSDAGVVIIRTLPTGVNDAFCVIQSWSDNEIICTMPPFHPGPVSILIRRFTDSLLSIGESWFYQSPSILSLTPSTVGTGFRMTIIGNNFGLNRMVSANGVNVGIVVSQSNYNQVVITVPPGLGTNIPISVMVTNPITLSTYASNTAYYNYSAPIISSINPRNCSTDGGIPITISGRYYGPIAMGSASVTIDGKPCTNLLKTIDNIEITCIIPPGVGVKYLIVTIAGQTSRAIAFSYNAPTIIAASGCPQNDFQGPGTTGECDRNGNIPITLTGTNFGTESDKSSLSVWVAAKEAVILSIPSSNQLLFNLTKGTGYNVTVEVRRSTRATPTTQMVVQSSGKVKLLSYNMTL